MPLSQLLQKYLQNIKWYNYFPVIHTLMANFHNACVYFPIPLLALPSLPSIYSGNVATSLSHQMLSSPISSSFYGHTMIAATSVFTDDNRNSGVSKLAMS